MNGIQEPGGLGKERGLQFRGGRDPIPGSDDDGGRIQVVETQLGQVGRDGVHHAATLDRITGQEHLAGLSDRLDQRPVVQRRDGAQIDQLGRQAEPRLQLLCRRDRRIERRAERDDR